MRGSVVAVLLAGSTAPACAPQDELAPRRPPSVVDAGDGAPAEQAIPEHRFFSLEQRPVRISSGSHETNVDLPPTRLYSRFKPAAPASGVAGHRLCVLFNGGPGVGSQFLWQRLSPELTSACDQLYIDARNAGFSYSLDAASSTTIDAHGSVLSDAADALLLLMQHLQSRPASRVTLIGESYGATRSSLMYELAQRTHSPEADWSYADSLLEQELAKQQPPLAKLFDSMAYLQPYVGGIEQDEWAGRLLEEPGSVLDTLALELGQTFKRCESPECDPLINADQQVTAWGRSVYDLRKPADWLTNDLNWFSQQAAMLAQNDEFSALSEITPAARDKAWRFLSTRGPADEPEWALLGKLNPRDRYYVSFNEEIFEAFADPMLPTDVSFFSPRWTESTITVIQSAALFVTDAKYDTVVVTGSLPKLLSLSSRVSSVEPHVASHWQVTLSSGEQKRVAVRSYDAGHSVADTQAAKLGADLTAWLDALTGPEGPRGSE